MMLIRPLLASDAAAPRTPCPAAQAEKQQVEANASEAVGEALRAARSSVDDSAESRLCEFKEQQARLGLGL